MSRLLGSAANTLRQAPEQHSAIAKAHAADQRTANLSRMSCLLGLEGIHSFAASIEGESSAGVSSLLAQ